MVSISIKHIPGFPVSVKFCFVEYVWLILTNFKSLLLCNQWIIYNQSWEDCSLVSSLQSLSFEVFVPVMNQRWTSPQKKSLRILTWFNIKHYWRYKQKYTFSEIVSHIKAKLYANDTRVEQMQTGVYHMLNSKIAATTD
jgi:hypothetical protein